MDDTQGNTAADTAATEARGLPPADNEFGPAIHQPLPRQAPAAAPRQEPAAAEQPKVDVAPTAPAKPAAPQAVYILDTTTTIANDEKNPRKHEQLVEGRLKPYLFYHGKPVQMPWAIALRFLKHDGFKLTNAEGELLEYQHRPRQPDEYGAGERFKLAEDEVIARYDELSTMALYRRALELPGGEQFQDMKGMSANEARAALIGFIKKMKKQMAEANKSREPDKPVTEAEDEDGDEADFN